MQESSMLSRYLKGQHQVVWQEIYLDGLNANSIDESTKQSVAREVAKRFVSNLREVEKYFLELGFQIKRTPSAILAANEATRLGIKKIEADLGQLPLLVKEIYSLIDSADFQQCEKQRESAVGPQCDGLVPNHSLSIQSPLACLSANQERSRTIQHERSTYPSFGGGQTSDTRRFSLLAL